jgi:SH3-like domain-containing protein
MREQDGKFILFDVEGFGAWLESSLFTRVIKLLQVHHTYQPDYKTFGQIQNHFVLLKNMERSHVIERGFPEIAQNLTTFPDGRVAVCRPIDTIPAGIKGANQYGICVENLGNFDARRDVMTPEHRDCIVKVFAHLCRRFHLSPSTDTIQYHHWWDLNTGKRTNGTGTTKTCPGTDFFTGNSVASAEANFIPLISQQIAPVGEGRVTQPHSVYSAEVAVDLLNVRTLPSSSGIVLKQLHRGAEVRVYENREGWSRIDPLGSCWVSSHFLQTVASSTVSPLYCAQVTAELLNIRSLPSISGKVVNQLKQGASVYIYEERDNWSRIDESGSLWACSAYLARVAAAKA